MCSVRLSHIHEAWVKACMYVGIRTYTRSCISHKETQRKCNNLVNTFRLQTAKRPHASHRNSIYITFQGYPAANDYVPLVTASTRNAKRSLVGIQLVKLGITKFFALEKHIVFCNVQRDVWAHNPIRIYKPYEASFLQLIT